MRSLRCVDFLCTQARGCRCGDFLYLQARGVRCVESLYAQTRSPERVSFEMDVISTGRILLSWALFQGSPRVGEERVPVVTLSGAKNGP